MGLSSPNNVNNFNDDFSYLVEENHSTCLVGLQWLPNQQRWYAKWKLSWNMYTLHTCLAHAQSVLIKKNSASELSWKFIESALLVGKIHLF